MRAAVMIAIVPMLLGGCDALGITGSSCDDGVGGDGISVSRDANGTVVFAWSDDCRVNELSVHEVDGPTVWAIERDSRRIGSPIVYGEVPEGTMELHAPVPLVLGREYLVDLSWDGQHTGFASTKVFSFPESDSPDN